MKTFLALFLMTSTLFPLFAAESSRLVHWKFMKGTSTVEASCADWERVTVPHTWNAEDGNNGGTYYRGPGWYQTTLDLSSITKNDRLFLRFNAAGTTADVFVNGQSIGKHAGGYTAFIFEITDRVEAGKSADLRVLVDNSERPDIAPLSGDFTVFGGLHRPVELLIKPAVSISPLDHASPGVYFSQTHVSKEQAELKVRVLVNNGLKQDCAVSADITLNDKDGRVIATSTLSDRVSAQKDNHMLEQSLSISKPHLWHGVKDPYLYTAMVELKVDGEVVDHYRKKIGFRFYNIDGQRGFFLNGEPYRLAGVNIHYDRAGKGAALSDNDIRDDFEHIREIGANCLRLAHYPHASLSYELCDELGIIAWAEIPLVNSVTHHPDFAPNARMVLTELIRQQYNHCSIFFWSICNEMFHRQTEDPMPLLHELHQLSKMEDPTRLTTLATNRRRPDLCNLTDTFAFNNYPGWYTPDYDSLESVISEYQGIGNNRGIAVSEYGAGASINHHDLALKRIQPNGHWHPEEWQAFLHEQHYMDIVADPSCWGSFVWAMFDFSSDGRDEGEHQGVNDKGLMTHDHKTPKDAFFFYQANWSERPLLHLTSKRFLVRDEARTWIKVYSNCSEIQLSINGKSYGTKKPNALKVALWEAIDLNVGENHVVVTAAKEACIDEVVWSYDPAASTNDQPTEANAATVKGLYSCSHHTETDGPENAFDGDHQTRWSSDQPGAWLAQELEKPVIIHGIIIDWYNGNDRNYRFQVETSTDGNTWRPAFNGYSALKAGPQTYLFDTEQESQHIRIICDGDKGSRYSAINEIQLVTK